MGYSFAKLMTVLMMLISVFIIVYSFIIYATSNPVAGWTTTILFLSEKIISKLQKYCNNYLSSAFARFLNITSLY